MASRGCKVKGCVLPSIRAAKRYISTILAEPLHRICSMHVQVRQQTRRKSRKFLDQRQAVVSKRVSQEP